MPNAYRIMGGAKGVLEQPLTMRRVPLPSAGTTCAGHRRRSRSFCAPLVDPGGTAGRVACRLRAVLLRALASRPSSEWWRGGTRCCGRQVPATGSRATGRGSRTSSPAPAAIGYPLMPPRAPTRRRGRRTLMHELTAMASPPRPCPWIHLSRIPPMLLLAAGSMMLPRTTKVKSTAWWRTTPWMMLTQAVLYNVELAGHAKVNTTTTATVWRRLTRTMLYGRTPLGRAAPRAGDAWTSTLPPVR